MKLNFLWGLLIVFGLFQIFGSAQGQQPPSESPQTIEALNNLINDPNCVLPCWWGLTLGESTLEDLQNLAVNNFGEVYPQSLSENYIHASRSFQDRSPNASGNRPALGTGFGFRQTDNKLAAISFLIGDPYTSTVNYAAYTPTGILATYGKPDEATISFLAAGSSIYGLNLRYDSLGLYLAYDMKVDPDADVNIGIPLCNNTIYSMRIWIEDDIDVYSDMMQRGSWNLMPQRQSFEEDIAGVTGMSLEAFTQSFSQPNTCIQTLPIDQWVMFAPPSIDENFDIHLQQWDFSRW